MANESILHLNAENFSQEVENSSVPVLVDFWAEWCGPCRMISPILDEIAEEKGEAIKIAKVNVDENQELADKYNVRSIPMLLFFKDGEQKDQHLGMAAKEALVKKLDALS